MLTAIEVSKETLTSAVDSVAVVIAAIGALYVLTRKYFQKIMRSLNRTEAQVHNGHGGGPSLREDMDTILATIQTGQRDARSDTAALSARVDDGFREVRADIRRLQGVDDALGDRVSRLESPAEVA